MSLTIPQLEEKRRTKTSLLGKVSKLMEEAQSIWPDMSAVHLFECRCHLEIEIKQLNERIPQAYARRAPQS